MAKELLSEGKEKGSRGCEDWISESEKWWMKNTVIEEWSIFIDLGSQKNQLEM